MTLAERIKEIEQTDYILKGSKNNLYWIGPRYGMIKKYVSKFKDNFNLVIYEPDELAQTVKSYFVIPFSILKDYFIPKYFSNDVLHLTINNNHSLSIHKAANHIDVSEFFCNPINLFSIELLSTAIAENENIINDCFDYEIENIKREVNTRLGQSKYRKFVLNNFNNKCCLSGIAEIDLLVASHIVPWSHDKQIRLDPTNGLCLFITYDKLFDKGYFSLDDNLQVIIPDNISLFSAEIQNILLTIHGRKISTPQKTIPKKYLEHHRKTIFHQP